MESSKDTEFENMRERGLSTYTQARQSSLEKDAILRGKNTAAVLGLNDMWRTVSADSELSNAVPNWLRFW